MILVRSTVTAQVAVIQTCAFAVATTSVSDVAAHADACELSAAVRATDAIRRLPGQRHLGTDRVVFVLGQFE